jgi:flagella basal body P-ring formation protein FlgA
LPTAFGQTSCLPVEGDQITGKDLARALPLFRAMPADTPLAPSPQPGGSRVFHLSELQSIASRFSVHLEAAPDVCFYIQTERLTEARVMQAMHDSLAIPDAVIEITELSTEPAPRGRIEFPRERLGTPALLNKRSPVLWRGFVVYAGERRFSVWANVWITAPVARIVSTDNLRQGVPIVASQVRREVTEAFPSAVSSDRTVDQVVGLAPLHAITAGSEVRLDNLVRPNDVVKGDLVRVDVRMGAAHLALNGRAESTGRVGDFIGVLNPDSSRTFQARIDGVVVEPIGGN